MNVRLLFSVLICLCLFAGCKHHPGDTKSVMDHSGDGKATAILWVDYNNEKLPLPGAAAIRTVKVYAHVFADEKVKILSFCKPQRMQVENYIWKRTEAYTIRKEIFEGENLHAGDQYLHLCCIPA